MVSEEIELNHALEAAGLTPVETDLGEWIVQLAGERPSHILAPVIHRSRGQIAEVLAAHSGGPMSDDPQGLVTYSREQLRSVFLEAGMGITGANFMIAETGTVVVLENEGNGRLVSSLPRVHVVLAGLERVLETTADAAFMVEQLTLAAVGRELPSYVSWLSGPARRRRRRPRGVRRDRARQRPLARARERRARDPQLHPLRLLPDRLPGLLEGRRPRLRLGLQRPDRRRAHAAADGHAARRGSQAAVPVVALRRLHGCLPRRHPAARHAHPRPRARQPRRARRARRASGLGRLVARLVEPAAVSRLGARRRALRAVRARLRARRELARGPRHAAAAEHASRSTGAGATWRTASDRRRSSPPSRPTAARRARRRQRRRPRSTSPGCSAATPRSASGRATRSCMSLDPASLGRETSPAEAFAGITGAAFGVAPTGTLVLTYGAGARARRGCCPTCTSRCCPPSASCATLEEAIAQVYAGDVPRAMTLVTGASATSDIEKIRVTGAHGPRRVAVVVIGWKLRSARRRTGSTPVGADRRLPDSGRNLAPVAFPSTSGRPSGDTCERHVESADRCCRSSCSHCWRCSASRPLRSTWASPTSPSASSGATDAAALAGAQDLPNVTLATQTAQEYATDNMPSNIRRTPSPTPRSARTPR